MVKPNLGRRCGSYAQDYRQIFRGVHPGVPKLGKKRFIACNRVRNGLDKKNSRPVIYKIINEPRRGGDVNVLDSSWEVQ